MTGQSTTFDNYSFRPIQRLRRADSDGRMKSAFKLRKPRTDDRLPWNIVAAIQGTPAVLVAYQLKLYSLLADKPSSLDEVCEAKRLKRRPAEAIWRSRHRWVLRGCARAGIR